MGETRDRRYRQMLLKLGDMIKSEDLEKLKFTCRRDIPTKYRERIVSAVAFFEVLEEREKLSECNLTYLKDVLKDAFSGRTDVLRIVNLYEQGSPISPDTDACRYQSPLSPVCLYLEKSLGAEFKFVIRRLKVSDEHIHDIQHANSSVREVIHQCLCLWLRDNENRQYEELLRDLINALKSEGRNDLVLDIERGNFG